MFYKNFYLLQCAYLKSEFRAKNSIKISMLESISYLKKEKPLSDAVFIHSMGSKLYDYVAMTDGMQFLLSERSIKLLTENNISGWEKYKIKLYKNRNEIYGYWGIHITGICGKIDNTKSEIFFPKPIVIGGKSLPHRKGLYFIQESWDGSDIFSPQGTGLVIIHERVKILFESNEITNITFTNITENERLL